MRKVSNPADLSRELRTALGNLTQAELAAKLLVSRNYISQIEAGLKKPSKRLLAQMEELLTESAKRQPRNTDEVSSEPEATSPHIVQETPVGQGSAEMVRSIRDHVDTLIWGSKGDPGRLGWIREQLNAYVAMPRHWVRNEELNQRVHEILRRRREEESGSELLPQHPQAQHKKATA